MSRLRVELFWDEEASNWHYRVPALHINGGGTCDSRGGRAGIVVGRLPSRLREIHVTTILRRKPSPST